MRLFARLAGFMAVAGLVAFSCAPGSDSQSDTLCQPGENIFCRCKGGAPGTKTCHSSGNTFAHCVNERGDDCTEVVDDSSAAATTGNPTTTGVGGGDSSTHG